MIDILIPAYNAHSTIEQTLVSIAAQTYKKLRVTIVDDASTETYDAIVDKFKGLINVRVVRRETNGGPGLVRQQGLDVTNFPYVMYMDADDVLLDNMFIDGTLKYMDANPKCVLVSANFLEEGPNGELNPHVEDMVWTFGKIYRRSYLQKRNIQFMDTRSNEDTEFNLRVRLLLGDGEFVQFLKDKFVYLWKYKEDSITRRNNAEYSYHHGITGALEARMRVMDLKELNPEVVKMDAVQMPFTFYNQYNSITHDRPEERG
jgi:glycosyltransferase involved in cell wall biosynthesis